MNRREFLAGLALAPAAAGAAPEAATDREPPAASPLMPPGAGNAARFVSRCTACGLCIAQCPRQALVPAGLDYGARGMMMPKLDFSHGFCDYHCHTCANLCPAGALRPIGHDEKCRTKLGTAEYRPRACVVERDKVTCGICAEHCPVQAIKMVADKDGRARPVVDPDKCIGCGACEYYCPAHPKAMRVKGLAAQGFAFGDLTLFAALPGHNRTWTSKERGLKPLFAALDGAADLRGAVCYDRIVGRAAAFLYAALGVKRVVAPVAADGAEKILASRHIELMAATRVPVIRNRTNTGMCPMEAAVREIGDDDTEGAVRALRAAAAALAGGK